jgi:small subunit ribosomal protein S21
MLIVKVKKGESIEGALKKMKRKVRNTKLVEQIRKNQEFKKPSVEKREQKLKAIYKQKLNQSD